MRAPWLRAPPALCDRDDADMAGPSWLMIVLAALMIATALYCAGRLVASGRSRRATELDADAVHVVMGVSMAGMLLPRLGSLPAGVWEVTFGVAAAWFAAQATRNLRGKASISAWWCSHPVPHLVESAAMIYMLAALPASGPGRPGQGMPMPGMGGRTGAGGGLMALAVVLALFMVGYVLWTADQLTSLARRPAAVAARDTVRPPSLVGAAAPAAGTREAMGAPADRPPAGSVHSAAAPVHRGGRPALAPGLAGCYKIAMGITMGYMLIAMF
jgi:Domain of unknown function (DUF5134)